MVSGQAVGIGLIFLFDWMIDNDYNHSAGWVATGLTGYGLPTIPQEGKPPWLSDLVCRLSCVVMLLFTGKLKRLEFERAEQAIAAVNS